IHDYVCILVFIIAIFYNFSLPLPLHFFLLFFFHSSRAHPYLHSFPTRRSSDLLRRSRALPQRYATLPVQQCYFDLAAADIDAQRSEEHTSELQSRENLVCRLLLEKKKKKKITDLLTT